MNMAQTTDVIREGIRITTYPVNWPRDKRSRTSIKNGVVYITHPEREPHTYNQQTKTWSKAS